MKKYRLTYGSIIIGLILAFVFNKVMADRKYSELERQYNNMSQWIVNAHGSKAADRIKEWSK